MMFDCKAMLLLALILILGFCSCSFAAPVIQVAAGGYHTVALKSDGTVWTWGSNNNGQLGDGTTINRPIPVQVLGISGVTAITAGGNHTVALKIDGTVWAWGLNLYGQLGNRSTVARSTPVQVSDLTGVTAISAGQNHTIALRNDGTVWAWGSNNFGELGSDSASYKAITPVQVSGLSEVTAIATGINYTIAVKSNGTVWTWGLNLNGQLGDGTATQRNTPVQVSGISGVIAVEGGYCHTVALKNNGTVWAWGSNYCGQIGDGDTINVFTPIQVSGIAGVTDVDAGWNETVALRNDGTVWAWGYNSSGQLGDGTLITRYRPVQTACNAEVTDVDAGYYHTVALKNNGTVWTWGSNSSGQLGDGSLNTSPLPRQVIGLDTIPPTGSFIIDAGAEYTITESLTITFSATDDNGIVAQMCISNDGIFDTEPWESYASSKNWTLSPGNGIKTVYVRFKDPSGNESDTLTGTIIFDTTPPSINSVTISPSMAVAGDILHVTVDAADLAGVLSITADGVTLTKTGSATWEGDLIAPLSIGTHSAAISAIDILGNSIDTSADYKTAAVMGISGKYFTDPIILAASSNWLFKTWGKVTIIDADSFYLDHGSGDPIHVIAPGYSGIANGDYVSVRGMIDVGPDHSYLKCKAEHIIRHR